MAWSAANELCKYEGSKIGLGQPDWWYDCWRGTADQSVDESAQQYDSQNDEPLTEPVEGAE